MLFSSSFFLKIEREKPFIVITEVKVRGFFGIPGHPNNRVKEFMINKLKIPYKTSLEGKTNPKTNDHDPSLGK